MTDDLCGMGQPPVPTGMLRLNDGTLLPDTTSVRRELAYRAASGYPLTNWSAGDYDPAEPAEPEPEDE